MYRGVFLGGRILRSSARSCTVVLTKLKGQVEFLEGDKVLGIRYMGRSARKR